MAQAECITTAIRELMSRGRPPKSTSPVRLAHTEFVAALAGNVPHPIYADIDSEDLEGRADHLEKVFFGMAGVSDRRYGLSATNGSGTHLCPTLCAVHPCRHCWRG